MNQPHLFVWSGGVLNLCEIDHAEIEAPSGEAAKRLRICSVRFKSGWTVALKGDAIGEFMLHCLRYHAGGKPEILARPQSATPPSLNVLPAPEHPTSTDPGNA